MLGANTSEGYIALDSIDSTNDELRRRLEDGRADEGSILTAATQTKGRGRGQKDVDFPARKSVFFFCSTSHQRSESLVAEFAVAELDHALYRRSFCR